ncbi:hypothetical protein CSKR_203470, partial [Clonorchis sinensis]
MRNALLIRLLKILRQPTTDFALLWAHKVGAVPEFPATPTTGFTLLGDHQAPAVPELPSILCFSWTDFEKYTHALSKQYFDQTDQQMAKRIGFKVSILTPWTLLPENLSADQCADENADKFADVLCSRIRTKLLRFSFWPRARGEAYICSSFDAFQERFLQYSEYAVIVLSGHHVSCLDSIYPRLLVFFTMRPSWSARFLLVFLGEPKGHFRFDTSILKHDAIIFDGSSEDHWSSDEQSWTKLFRILK